MRCILALFFVSGFLLSALTMEQPRSSYAIQDESSSTIALINGQVIDGTGAKPIANGGVLIEDSQIIFVGAMDEIELSEDMMVIDVAGRTILPGIFNAHMHGFGSAIVRQLSYLSDGVTSLFNMGSFLNQMDNLEIQILPDGSVSTNSFQAGPIITAVDGYQAGQVGYQISGVDEAEEAEEAVLELTGRGADYIKIALTQSNGIPVLTQAEVNTIVTIAHENDLVVNAHILAADSMLEIALEAGVDVFQHVPHPYSDMQDTQYSAIEDFRKGEAEHIILSTEFEAQLLQAIEQGIILVPTLNVYTFRNISDEYVDAYRQLLFDVVRFYYENGGRIAVGNDIGNPGVSTGMPIVEMLLLQEASLTPFDILVAGTYHAALACGQADWVGTLAVDMLADVIVVDGNPLEDLMVMDEVMVIIKSGQIVENDLLE